ncbi:hypothetical protein ACOMHN_015353 [Nucella lapillus]
MKLSCVLILTGMLLLKRVDAHSSRQNLQVEKFEVEDSSVKRPIEHGKDEAQLGKTRQKAGDETSGEMSDSHDESSDEEDKDDDNDDYDGEF